MNKVLGLDLGSRTLGIAISDVLGIAHGRENFRFQEGAYKEPLMKVKEIIEETGIKEIALGYPLNMDGSRGKKAEVSEIFKERIEGLGLDVKVTLVDERLTTVMANKRLLEADLSRHKRHKVIDQQAAVVILETYLKQKEFNDARDY